MATMGDTKDSMIDLGTKLPAEKRFADNMTGIGELLVYTVSSAPKDSGAPTMDITVVNFMMGVINNLDPKVVMAIFIEHSHKHWDKILKRDREFFITNVKEIFAYFPTTTVDPFAILFSAKKPNGEYYIGNEDVSSYWEYFESQVRICISHIHTERQPYAIRQGLETVTGYSNPKYFEAIDLPTQAKLFGVHLSFS